MDPPVMSGFRSSNTAVCNLTEIWPFPINRSGGGGAYVDENGAYVDNDDPMVVDNNNNNNNNNNQIVNNNINMKRRDDDDDDDDSSKGVSTSSNSMLDSDGKRLKSLALENKNESKPECERSAGKRVENSTNAVEPSKQDYIHVRARRGQATDSHSLAERARREKISKRMKVLQDLVPGCNKVIGKALVLDEIINYIQSLQQQVQFLSMKLEAVTSRSHPSPQGFPSKDYGQQTFECAGVPYGSQPPREFSRGSSPEWLHMQIGGSFERTT